MLKFSQHNNSGAAGGTSSNGENHNHHIGPRPFEISSPEQFKEPLSAGIENISKLSSGGKTNQLIKPVSLFSSTSIGGSMGGSSSMEGSENKKPEVGKM